MSVYQNTLCSLIMREFYGEVVEKVAGFLLKKGIMPLGGIVQETELKVDQVKRALAVMIQQNICHFSQHKRGHIEYGVDVNRILLRPRFPRYIYTAKMLYADHAELLIEELLQHGQVTINSVVQRVTKRLNEAFQEEKKVTAAEVRAKFVDLAETHFVQRCPEVSSVKKSGNKSIPLFTLEEQNLYRVPDVEVDVDEDSKKRKRSTGDQDGPASKRQKTDTGEAIPDEPLEQNTYWRVNYDRFHQYMRDQAIIAAIGKKIDQKAAEVVRTILRISEVKSDPNHGVTTPISSHDIFQAIPKDLEMTKTDVDQYLNLLTEDSTDFVVKAGDSGGGMYSIHIKNAMLTLARAHIESVVQERFGSKSLRIFKLLVMKKQLEQKQIEEFAMIPAKEAKEMLYRMFGENFISHTELPRTPDHAPARTFYLFSCNIQQIARMLLNNCYKTMGNLIIRREYETKEYKRLLEKQQRVEAIAASLEQTGADPTQREEIEDMISPPERAQLAKVKHMTNKLEQSGIQLNDTIFTLATYLKYVNVAVSTS